MLIVLIILLALILGGFGLLVKGLLWLFLIAVVVFVVGAFMGVKAFRS